MPTPPFSLRAVQSGMKDFGLAVKAVGNYQATGGFVMRAWAQQNGDTLVRYIRAYVDGLRWALDPANKDEAVKLLAEGLQLPPDIPAPCYAIEADPAPRPPAHP